MRARAESRESIGRRDARGRVERREANREKEDQNHAVVTVDLAEIGVD